MNRPNGANFSVRGAGLMAGLCALVLAIGCSSGAGRPSTANAGAGGDGGDGGSEAGSGGSGGAGGTTSTPPTSVTGGAGGSDTGGSGGSSGSSGSGGAGGTGGDMGTGGMSGAGGADMPDAAMMSMDSGSTGGGSDGGGPNPNSPNPCPAKVTNYTLNGFSVKDFCDAYEHFCQYTPDGSLKSKCGPGQKIGPLFKDRADCEMQYTMASATGKGCRAGQLCQNAPRGLLVNACSHATGYCAGACGQ